MSEPVDLSFTAHGARGDQGKEMAQGFNSPPNGPGRYARPSRRSSGLASVVLCALVFGLVSALPANAATVSAAGLLGRLSVAAEAGAGSYDRARFKLWIDADGDGCDTREEVLIAESTIKTKRGAGCSITTGRWRSVFDGRTWTKAGDVDIDHAVPLAEAWRSGARSWSRASRRAFANDLTYRPVLGVMTDNLNSTKQDRDPGVWLPPTAQCAYAARWVAVKYRYSLTVDIREKAGLAAVLSGSCGARTLTAPALVIGGAAPTPVVTSPATGLPLPIVSMPTVTPTSAPTTPSAPVTVSGSVWPGAYCAQEDHWDYGYTAAGTLMRCTTTVSDSRFRWRSA